MQCPSCGVDASEHQKFCHECGVALHPASTVDADLATGPVEIVEPEPDGAAADEPTTIDADLATEPVVMLPAPIAAMRVDQPPTTPIVTAEDLAGPTDLTGPTPSDAEVTTEMYAPGPATTTATAVTTAEMPAIFDGHDDLAEYPTPREPFRLRVIFLFALFGAVATLMTIVADVIDIRTTRPTSGIVTGARNLEDIGSNLGLGGFVGAAVMVIGALLACFGLRWGAGLAGGAGLALVGWAGLTIGLAEFPIAVAESITRTSPESFTLRVTRDIGWWLIVAIGAIGAVVFLASLRWIGRGRRPALNPLIAALTAVAAVVLAAGPLVPVGTATFADNFRSTDPERDLPTAFFAGRLGQLALIAFAGVVGMLIVRAYGLGLAAGSVSVATWLWVSSLIELGNRPIGIADRNPGADDTVPHAVTTVGMVATLALLAVAAALAVARLNRREA